MILNKYVREKKYIPPEQVLLKAFEYFKTDTLDLESLIRIALAANCPSPIVAQGVLLNMVEIGLLTWEEKGDKVFFTVVSSQDSRQH